MATLHSALALTSALVGGVLGFEISSRETEAADTLSRNMRKKPSVAASPAVECSVSFWTTDEQTWAYLLGLLAVQLFGREVFKRWGPFKDDAALFVHQLCSLFCIAHCGIYGLYYWYGGEAASVEDRMYGPTVGAVVIGRVNMAFQIYDLVTTLFISRLRKVEMVVHHAMGGTMIYLLLRDCYVHWYAIFYLGISEISSIPLVFVDVFKFFPNVAAKFPTVNNLLRMAFALLFILLRGLYWAIVSARHLYDTFLTIQTGTVHNFQVMVFCALCNVVLTLMQWYWSYLIVRAVIKMVSGKKKNDDCTTKDKTA